MMLGVGQDMKELEYHWFYHASIPRQQIHDSQLLNHLKFGFCKTVDGQYVEYVPTYEVLFFERELAPCGPQVVPKWSPVVPKWSPSGLQVVSKWSPSGLQGVSKWSSSGPQVVLK